eukprot:38622_1
MAVWSRLLICLSFILKSYHCKPNIIFILTDDQDITLGGMNGMKKTQDRIVKNGLTFTNSFVSSPICCVSRSSIMSGQYVHNHGTTNNSINGGCSNSTWQQNIEPKCMSVHIKNAGYTTFYSGKYLNLYGLKFSGGPSYIPPGWDHWYGLVGNSRYYNYSISNNGKLETHGDDYYADYYTDLIHNQSVQFISSYDFNSEPPLFMMLGTPAAHGPFTPAPQYQNYDANKTAPRTPNYNNVAVNKYKHDLFRKYITTPLNDAALQDADAIWRHRHGTLQSVDDMIEDIYQQLKQKGVLDNTYFVYFSDNGFQDGQFGQAGDKRQLFENDIRVPFYISGPGIVADSTSNFVALNIDIAPTLIDIAGGSVPSYMDGMSLTAYLSEDTMDAKNIKQQFLVEYYGEIANKTTGLFGPYDHPIDSWNNTYSCVRMINGKQNRLNGTIYCKFKCYDRQSHIEVECPDKDVPQFYGSMYDLDADYYQLDNVILNLNETEDADYMDVMTSLLNCKGQTQCNSLRH